MNVQINDIIDYIDDIKLDDQDIIMETGDELFKIGCLLESEGNFKEMEKYYIKAFEAGISDAYVNLGQYHFKNKNYFLMLIYYQEASNNENSDAMYNLGYYYHAIEKDYVRAEEYYLLAIKYQNTKAMNNLAWLYQERGNYDIMIEYYLMAIENGEDLAAYNLGSYYHTIKINHKLMKKYYLIAIEKNNKKAAYNLGCYYESKYKNKKIIKYYLLAFKFGYENVLNDIIEFYDKRFLKLEKMIFYVNNIDKVNRKLVIDSINAVAISYLNLKGDFLEIIKKFEFKDDDSVLPIVRLLNLAYN
jgi:TPR repeat protein